LRRHAERIAWPYATAAPWFLWPFWIEYNRQRIRSLACVQHRGPKDLVKRGAVLRAAADFLATTNATVQWLLISDDKLRTARCHISYQSLKKQCG
jgi:hypothetical protein